ncbi:MAG: hypothetical protein QM811_31560 [Pirellulales bacterium]
MTLGHARRSWMLVSLSNERDRPSLTLPRAAVVCETLEAFGWNAARQTPRTDRETSPGVLQPGVLANGTLSVWTTRRRWFGLGGRCARGRFAPVVGRPRLSAFSEPPGDRRRTCAVRRRVVRRFRRSQASAERCSPPCPAGTVAASHVVESFA